MKNSFKHWLHNTSPSFIAESLKVSTQTVNAWKFGKSTPKMRIIREFAKLHDPLDVILYFSECEERRNMQKMER